MIPTTGCTSHAATVKAIPRLIWQTRINAMMMEITGDLWP